MESQKLVEIDNLLLEAAERLSGITEFTTYAYTSQYEKMDETVRIYDTLIHLQEGVNNELQEIDNDFFLRLANGTDRKHQGPMEALSSIHMEDISIPNQAGITRQWVYYNTSNQRCLGEAEKKEELTFQDFLCYSKDTEYETVYNPIFQEIFQEQYELSGLTQDYTYIEYMDGLLKAGEFNHEMYKPVQEFLSAGLDIITFGAKPLIEAFVGEDLITGEQMTETERYLRAIEGIVGLVSFGSIWSKLGKIGIEGVTAELAIEVMSDTSSTITSTSMNKLGANGIVSTVAGIIAGGITGSSINNAINTRVWSSHIETPEVPETPFQIQRETIQVEELPNRIDIDTRNNLSQLDGLEGGGDTVAYHSVGGDNSAKKIQSVLDGIDISYTSPESRFGQGFYVAADGNTTVAELAYHGTDAKYSIRYDMNLEGQKVLDLTDPKIASEWGFLKGESSLLECQNIAEIALDEGYNVIKVHSYRDAGINYVIYDNFDEILQPQMVTPIGD